MYEDCYLEQWGTGRNGEVSHHQHDRSMAYLARRQTDKKPCSTCTICIEPYFALSCSHADEECLYKRKYIYGV